MAPASETVMTEDAFRALDQQCADRLKAVSFGLQNSCDRIVKGIRFKLGKQQSISWRQRTAMYQICYRFRRQIGDTRFIARVLIAKAEADPHADAERQVEHRPRVRAWAADDLFSGGGLNSRAQDLQLEEEGPGPVSQPPASADRSAPIRSLHAED